MDPWTGGTVRTASRCGTRRKSAVWLQVFSAPMAPACGRSGEEAGGVTYPHRVLARRRIAVARGLRRHGGAIVFRAREAHHDGPSKNIATPHAISQAPW